MMSNIKVVSLVAILAVAAVMIAATTVIPANDAFAHRHRGHHHGNTAIAIQRADNSQHVSVGNGGCTGGGSCHITNDVHNTQTQTQNVGNTSS